MLREVGFNDVVSSRVVASLVFVASSTAIVVTLEVVDRVVNLSTSTKWIHDVLL